MTEKPNNFQDIVAIISFEDVGPLPVCGYAVTDEDGSAKLHIKLPNCYVPWERVLSWRYLAALWPGYLTEGINYDE